MVFWLALTTRSQPSTALRAAGAQAHGLDVLGVRGDLQMAPYRAALLRQPRHVEAAEALALQVRGHADDRADGHHAGAADAGDHDAVRLVQRRQLGSGSCREQRFGLLALPAQLLPLRRPPPCTVTKLGQKPFTQE